MVDPIIIAGAIRTPIGGFDGVFAGVPAPKLGAVAIRGSLESCGLDARAVNEVIFGCVLSAGVGQAPARQAALEAGIPESVGATTINKMCGSGMKAVMLGHDLIVAETCRVVVAGGMESMSSAPYMVARKGHRLGHSQLLDHMFIDGLEDAYEKGRLMGGFAEECADRFAFTRDAQDDFALASLSRAKTATTDGKFARELAPVQVSAKGGQTTLVMQDEQPFKANSDKIRTMRPAFRANGTITAANSSSISDGAASLVLMKLSDAERQGVTPLARIVGHSTFAASPSQFPTAPVGAINKLMEKVGWETKDVDLFEINEAFAVVALAAMHELKLPHSNVNIYGGACALGHPLGASGARIIVTLLSGLIANDLKRGVASACIGGGEATAIAVERVL